MFGIERVEVGNGNHWGIGNYELLISSGNIKGMKPKEIGKLVILMMELVEKKREYEEAEMAEGLRQSRHWRKNEADRKTLDRKAVYALLAERDGEHCKMIGCDRMPLEIDHIFPISKGGKHDLDNLQFLCRHHNARKKNKDWATFLEEYMNDE